MDSSFGYYKQFLIIISNLPYRNLKMLLPTLLQDHMRSLTGARSVPRVFIGGKCVGGGDEVASLDAKGKLKPMLEDLGAL